MTIRIVSWNILSQGLIQPQKDSFCEKGYFYKDATILEEEYRFKRFVDVISGWMREEYIICLQEVPWSWWLSNEIQESIIREQYEIATEFYGTSEQYYMGVIICVPISRYKVKENKKIHVQALIDDISGLENYKDITVLKKKRKDIYLVTKIKDKINKNEAWIATIHMPCWFFIPFLMKKIFQQIINSSIFEVIKESIPYIWVGDYNMNPFLIEEVIETYQKNMLINIKSIFSKKEDSEGICTTVTVGNRDPEQCYNKNSFAGCIDNCIYITPTNMKCDCKIDLTKLPIIIDKNEWYKKMYFPEYNIDKYSEIIPNAECISDHYPIFIDIFFYR